MPIGMPIIGGGMPIIIGDGVRIIGYGVHITLLISLMLLLLMSYQCSLASVSFRATVMHAYSCALYLGRSSAHSIKYYFILSE
jgi:hypothetical protein